jgi:hypothetical protein
VNKTCIRCGVTKPLSDYSLDKGKHINTCKRCKCDISAAWHSKNREKANERSLRYGRENAKTIAHKAALWRAANPERSREAKRRCYEKQRDYYRAKRKEWLAEHANDPQVIERQRTRTRNRRARLRNVAGRHTATDIQSLYEKQGGKCEMCKVKLGSKFHVDHVMPVALGGSNGPENLQLLCARCNWRKSAKHPDDWAKENGRLF